MNYNHWEPLEKLKHSLTIRNSEFTVVGWSLDDSNMKWMFRNNDLERLLITVNLI